MTAVESFGEEHLGFSVGQATIKTKETIVHIELIPITQKDLYP